MKMSNRAIRALEIIAAKAEASSLGVFMGWSISEIEGAWQYEKRAGKLRNHGATTLNEIISFKRKLERN
jgi:hypothetical protein